MSKNNIVLEDIEQFKKDKKEIQEKEKSIKVEEKITVIPSGYFEYEPLSNGLIEGIPKKLNYKYLDILSTFKLGDFEYDTLIDNIVDFLDSVCYQTKLKKFSHIEMSEADIIHAILFYLAKNTGVVKKNVSAICPECNKVTTIQSLNLSELETKELPLAYKDRKEFEVLDNTGKKRVVNIEITKIKYIKIAEDYIEKLKKTNSSIAKADREFLNLLSQTYAIALSIIQIDDKTDLTLEEKIKFYSEEILHESRIKITKEFNKYDYGTKLEIQGICLQPNCPTIIKDQDTGEIEKDNKTKHAKRRMVALAIPFQKSFFNSSDS